MPCFFFVFFFFKFTDCRQIRTRTHAHMIAHSLTPSLTPYLTPSHTPSLTPSLSPHTYTHSTHSTSLHLSPPSRLSLVYVAQGIPIVYYGTEQGFSGGDDPANREDLWRSGYSTNTQLFKLTSTLAATRHNQTSQFYNSQQMEKYVEGAGHVSFVQAYRKVSVCLCLCVCVCVCVSVCLSVCV